MTVLISPADGGIVSLLTEEQKAFLTGTRADASGVHFDYLNLLRQGTDRSAPAKVLFSWETDEPESVLVLSEDPSFPEMPAAGAALSDAGMAATAFAAAGRAAAAPVVPGTDVRVIRTAKTETSIGNLKIGQTYYWRVGGSAVHSFTTEDLTPRWIFAEGATNIRDLGGWKTQEGKRVRQGLIYRGSELDWISYRDRDPRLEPQAHTAVTEEGRRILREELRIRTDLDLRLGVVGGLTESPLGPDVSLRLIPSLPYDEFLAEDQYPAARAIFECLADASAYPVYYHCWGGADRTGTIAYLLLAYLGVPEEDLILDYELTSLSIFGIRARTLGFFREFMRALAAFDPEGTPKSRAERFLRACGLSEDTLASLKQNLLEEN